MIGFFGGILGGLAGVSGALPVVWTDIRGWTKEQRRAVMQMFNIAILSLALRDACGVGTGDARSGAGGRHRAASAIVGAQSGAFIYRGSPITAISA